MTGDVGLGAMTIDHEPSDGWDDNDWNDNDWRDHDRNDTGNACIGDAGVQG